MASKRLTRTVSKYWYKAFTYCLNIRWNIKLLSWTVSKSQLNSFPPSKQNWKTCHTKSTIKQYFSGIGLEVSKCLASRGCRVLVACRTSPNKLTKFLVQETSNSNIVVKYLDLKSFTSVRKFAKDLLKTETKIDILVNNAGIAFDLSSVTEDKVDSLLQTNIVSSFLLIHLLIG